MPAIGVLGVALFALQVGVGYGVYRALADGAGMTAVILGISAAGIGILSLVVGGLVLTLVLDFVVLLAAVLGGRRFQRRPTAR